VVRRPDRVQRRLDWADIAHLSDFAQAAAHRAAKSAYDRWYDGYQVVVAEVRGAYGDGRFPHLTSPIAKIRRPSGAPGG